MHGEGEPRGVRGPRAGRSRLEGPGLCVCVQRLGVRPWAAPLAVLELLVSVFKAGRKRGTSCRVWGLERERAERRAFVTPLGL